MFNGQNILESVRVFFEYVESWDFIPKRRVCSDAFLLLLHYKTISKGGRLETPQIDLVVKGFFFYFGTILTKVACPAQSTPIPSNTEHFLL